MKNFLAAFFNFIAKTVAVLFAALFVAATVLVLLLLGIDRALLNAETYKRALAENNVYEQLPELVAEQFSMLESFLADPCAANPLFCVIDGASPELQACLTDALGEEAIEEIGSGRRNATDAELDASRPCLDQFGQPASSSEPDGGTGGPPTFLSNISPDQWGQVIRLLLPPDELQHMTESALDEVFAYLNGERDTASLSLVNLKARLAGETGRDLILLLVSAQPPCTAEEEARILAGDFGGEGEPQIMCAASGEALDKLFAELQRQLDEAASTIPDEATLIAPPSLTEPSSGEGPFGGPQDPFKMIRIVIDFSPLVPLALLMFVTIFGVRSAKGWLRWWGIPILVAGLIVLAIGLAVLPLFEWGWPRFAIPKVPGAFSSSNLVPLGHDLARSVLSDLSKWIVIAAALTALAGLAALVGSSFIKSKADQAARVEPAGEDATDPKSPQH